MHAARHRLGAAAVRIPASPMPPAGRRRMRPALLNAVIVLRCLTGVFSLVQWIARERAGHERSANDYSPASKVLL